MAENRSRIAKARIIFYDILLFKVTGLPCRKGQDAAWRVLRLASVSMTAEWQEAQG